MARQVPRAQIPRMYSVAPAALCKWQCVSGAIPVLALDHPTAQEHHADILLIRHLPFFLDLQGSRWHSIYKLPNPHNPPSLHSQDLLLCPELHEGAGLKPILFLPSPPNPKDCSGNLTLEPEDVSGDPELQSGMSITWKSLRSNFWVALWSAEKWVMAPGSSMLLPECGVWST